MLPEMLCTPATTEAAVAPVDPILFEEGSPPITPLRATCAADPIEPFEAAAPKLPAVDVGTPVDADRVIRFGWADAAAWLALAAAMVGKPEPVVTALCGTAGGGTKLAVEGFAGSS